MQKLGVGAMLLFAQESLYYLFGYDGGGFVFFQCAVFPLDPGKPTALLCRKPDVAQAAHLFDMCQIWINAVGNNPAEDLCQLLAEAGIKPGAEADGGTVLGLETDTYGLTGRNHALLLEALSDHGHAPPRGPPFKECSHIVRGLRMIKSPAEIEKMRFANELCDRAILAGLAAAKPGILDAVVSGAAYNAMISGGGDLPVSWLVNSGSATTYGRSITGSRTLQSQDEIVMEICGLHTAAAHTSAVCPLPSSHTIACAMSASDPPACSSAAAAASPTAVRGPTLSLFLRF